MWPTYTIMELVPMATKQNKAKKLRINFRKCMMRLITMIGNYTYIHT